MANGKTKPGAANTPVHEGSLTGSVPMPFKPLWARATHIVQFWPIAVC